MTLEAWALFCITETVLCFTPGPAVLFVVSVALTRGSRDGIHAMLGIVAGNSLYFAISATTIGAMLLASYELFFLIKWLGAGYLIWIGANNLLFARRDASEEARARVEASDRSAHAFVQGFLTQASNPKALIFFSAILPQFVHPGQSVPLQVAILGVSSQVIEILVLSLYVALASRVRSSGAPEKLAVPLQRVGGVLLMTAGARLATVAR